MVLQKAIGDLKGSPKEDKVAVASGIAVSVVIVLLAAWAIYFFRNIQKGTQQVNISGGAQDSFNFDTVKQAQQQIQQGLGSSADELQQVRTNIGSQVQTPDTGAQAVPQVTTDQFGAPSTSF
jgi:hypothetical protein